MVLGVDDLLDVASSLGWSRARAFTPKPSINSVRNIHRKCVAAIGIMNEVSVCSGAACALYGLTHLYMQFICNTVGAPIGPGVNEGHAMNRILFRSSNRMAAVCRNATGRSLKQERTPCLIG